MTATFTFSEPEGNVGEPLVSQIAISSTARPNAAPIVISSVVFEFNGSLDKIQLLHKADESDAAKSAKSLSSLCHCSLEESNSGTKKHSWEGSADLTIYPGQTKAFAFPLAFREAGDVELVESSFQISTDRFELVCSTSVAEDEIEALPTWWIKAGSGLKARKLTRGSGNAIKILPKPPKMGIRLPNLFEQYYTDEPISVDIEISNEEDEDTEAVLEVRLLGRDKDKLGYSWAHESSAPDSAAESTADENSEMDLPGHVVGKLARGAKATQTIRFKAPSEPSDYALEVKVLYHLLSDRDIPISKTLIADLVFIGPFEANYEFIPRVHPDPWPSYFELQENDSTDSSTVGAFGLAQMWQLEAKLASFATEPLVIQDTTLAIHAVNGGAICTITKEFEVKDSTINPQDFADRTFCLDTRKLNLEERRSTGLDMSLDVTWRRQTPGSASVTTSLPIPRVHVPGSEPRVLATAIPSKTVPPVIHLNYTLENPTMHFLTFELSMEASEEFGFSGAKLKVLHLLPMSRKTVGYRILPLVRGKWISPQLRVLDRYFNKALKVQATGSLRVDRKGVSVWVDVDEDGVQG